MSQPVRARRPTEHEGQYLLHQVRRGNHETILVRRALIVMASVSQDHRAVRAVVDPPVSRHLLGGSPAS